MKFEIFLLLCAFSLVFVGATNSANVCNACMTGRGLKSVASAEPGLQFKCSAFKERSCCYAANETQVYMRSNGSSSVFTYDHCPVAMSKSCKERFRENDCFFFCSPNMGPWLQNITNSAMQKPVGIPLKVDTCNTWYNDCKNDYTCNSDWTSPWNYTTGTTKCAGGCKRFSEIFITAKNMCETIYSNRFKVAPSGGSAMFLWFIGTENPNDQVAKLYAKDKGMSCDASRIQLGVLTTMMTSAIVLFLH